MAFIYQKVLAMLVAELLNFFSTSSMVIRLVVAAKTLQDGA